MNCKIFKGSVNGPLPERVKTIRILKSAYLFFFFYHTLNGVIIVHLQTILSTIENVAYLLAYKTMELFALTEFLLCYVLFPVICLINITVWTSLLSLLLFKSGQQPQKHFFPVRIQIDILAEAVLTNTRHRRQCNMTVLEFNHNDRGRSPVVRESEFKFQDLGFDHLAGQGEESFFCPSESTCV